MFSVSPSVKLVVVPLIGAPIEPVTSAALGPENCCVDTEPGVLAAPVLKMLIPSSWDAFRSTSAKRTCSNICSVTSARPSKFTTFLEWDRASWTAWSAITLDEALPARTTEAPERLTWMFSRSLPIASLIRSRIVLLGSRM